MNGPVTFKFRLHVHSKEFSTTVKMVQTKEFNLSAKTVLFITSKAKTNNRPYAALRKSKEINGPQRYFYMSLQKLAAFLKIITNIQILLKRDTDKEQFLAVDDYMKISVSTFRGKKYVGFVNTGKKPSRMNIDIEEFKVLAHSKVGIKNFIDSINQMQHKSEEAEFETPSERTVNLFKWGYFDVESGELIKEGDKWYFDADRCNDEGKAAEPSIDLLPCMRAPEFFTFSSSFDVPEEELMVKQAFIYIMKKYVERRRDGDCFACCQNIPLVNSLHDDGCCMTWDDSVEKYFSTVMYQEPQEDVKRICSYIVAKMHGNGNTSFLLDVTFLSRPLALEVEHWRKYLKGNYDLYQAADEASCLD